MKKMIAILLSLFLVMSAAACGQAPENNVIEDDVKKTDEVIPLEITAERITDEEYDEDVLVYTVIQDVIKVGDEDAAAYPELTKEIEAVMDADSEAIAYSKENMMEQYIAMEGMFSGFADEWTSEIIRADSRLVSIRQDQYTYSGGAHPMYGSLGVNIDTASGKRLTISDVVTDFEKFTELVESSLSEDYEEVFYDREDGFLDELDPESFNWTMDYESLKVYFNPYMLAPYAAGMQEATLYFMDYPELFNEKYTESPGPDAGDDYYGAGTVSHELYGTLIKRINEKIAEKENVLAGYLVQDINGNGTPELMVGEDSDTDEGNLIYTLYTCADDRPVHVFESFARSSYTWLGDGKFFYFGSSGAANSGFGVFFLPPEGTELECENFWFSDIKPGTEDEIAYYNNQSGSWKADESEELDISQDEFWDIEEELRGSTQKIELTQFAD